MKTIPRPPLSTSRLAPPALAALLALAGAAPTAASEAAPAPFPLVQDPEPQPEDQPEDPVERLEAWPELEDENAAEREVARLRKARTEVMGEEAHAALVATGAGVAPLLLKALNKERDEGAVERMRAVLVEVTDARHTRLLAPCLELDRYDNTRRFALERIAHLGDPGLTEAADAALEAARALKEDEAGVVARERYLAALCAASCGSTEGFDLLLVAAEKDWGDSGRELRTALERVRTDEASRLALVALGASERGAKVGALRLLAGCGTEVALPQVRQVLDSSDNTLRVEAINACRGIVDGDPPIEKLSAFDAIERANAWKGRL